MGGFREDQLLHNPNTRPVAPLRQLLKRQDSVWLKYKRYVTLKYKEVLLFHTYSLVLSPPCPAFQSVKGKLAVIRFFSKPDKHQLSCAIY